MKLDQKSIKIKKDLINGVFSLLVAVAVDELDIVAQKVRDYFKNHLTEVLTGDDVLKEVLNEELLSLFSSSEDGRLNSEELLKILLANEEKLTNKEFLLDGKPAEPTAANWLKDFIKKTGSGMFDNIVSSKYAIDSENGKKLDSTEKKTIIDLTAVYRNLKFFPDVFGDTPVDKWNIIPVELSEVKKEMPVKSREVFDTIQARTVVPPVIKAAEQKKSAEDTEKLAQLNETLNKYSTKSLQYKVVEEEIKKMNKK